MGSCDRALRRGSFRRFRLTPRGVRNKRGAAVISITHFKEAEEPSGIGTSERERELAGVQRWPYETQSAVECVKRSR